MIEETEETSQQMFERVKIQIESTKQESEEILKYQTKEAKQDPKQKEQEIKDLKSDASIFPLIERDLQEFNRDFSEDPALENFKLKYEVNKTTKQQNNTPNAFSRKFNNEIFLNKANFLLNSHPPIDPLPLFDQIHGTREQHSE